MLWSNRSALLFASLIGCFTASAFGQSVISAHSGVVHLSQGAVFIGGQQVDQRFGTFPDIKEKASLTTTEGRAEVLLTPGIFLRVGEDSAIRMISNRLIDTRVEFVSGEAMVESDITYKDNKDTHVALVYGDYTVTIARHGLFSLQSNPAQLKVFSGEVEVAHGSDKAQVKEGRLMPFSPALAAEKFDNKDGDSLYRWSQNRSQSLAVANVSAAKSARDSGFYSSGVGSWFFNQNYGMYTYLPGGRDIAFSPFGYSFYTPYSVYSGFYIPVMRTGAPSGARTALPVGNTVSLHSPTLAAVNNSNSNRIGSPSVRSAGAPTGGMSTGGVSVSRGMPSGGISVGGGRNGVRGR
ncbi:MAG TPA: hypothetical protein DEQ47_19090 [Solibacterales bacterium]|nr:hypothetical protein [Bryobacterales bacterium]